MTVHRKQDPHDLPALARLDETEIRFLWAFAWFDGPLHGMAEYQGKRVWFDFNSYSDDDCHYHYVLYPLTRPQEEMADLWHATKGTWDGTKWVGRDLEKHDESWAGPDFTDVIPIGWFADGRNENFYGVKVVC